MSIAASSGGASGASGAGGVSRGGASGATTSTATDLRFAISSSRVGIFCAPFLGLQMFR